MTDGGRHEPLEASEAGFVYRFPEQGGVACRGPGVFVTRADWTSGRGERRRWESRRARKSSPRLNPRKDSSAPAGALWHPRALSWWIGSLFMVGASCFAAASVPGFADAAGLQPTAAVYFVGSIFFTSAAYLQFFESVNTARERTPSGDGSAGSEDGHRRGRPRLVPFGWRPHLIDYWATLIQFAGTLLFNVNTFRALDLSLQGHAFDRAVWRPDAVGSICFLVASYLALAEVQHSFWRLWGSGLSWWIAVLNMAGSIAFGVSAVGAWQNDSGHSLNATAAGLGTLIGAVCFFSGALLLLPEVGREQTAPELPPVPALDA